MSFPKGIIFPLLQGERKTRIGSVKGIVQKVFYCCSVFKEKKFCPLIDGLAVLAFSRKGSGVLPAGRLVGLRCFTIRKAKGKNKIKAAGRLLSFLILNHSIHLFEIDTIIIQQKRYNPLNNWELYLFYI